MTVWSVSFECSEMDDFGAPGQSGASSSVQLANQGQEDSGGLETRISCVDPAEG